MEAASHDVEGREEEDQEEGKSKDKRERLFTIVWHANHSVLRSNQPFSFGRVCYASVASRLSLKS